MASLIVRNASRILSLFSSYLYLLSLMHVETPQGLPSYFIYAVCILSLSKQSQFLSNFHPF